MFNVFLGLGSNVGDSIAIVRGATGSIAEIPGVYDLKSSRLYRTSPVSDIAQPDFINGAVQLSTTLSAGQLLTALQDVERRWGKLPKPKNAPRPIDIDIIFFGHEQHETPELQVPHPAWKERLFVLIPLLDLTTTVSYPDDGVISTLDLREYIQEFETKQQYVFPLI